MLPFLPVLLLAMPLEVILRGLLKLLYRSVIGRC